MNAELAIHNIGLAKEQFNSLLNRLAKEDIVGAEEVRRGRIFLGALLMAEQSCALAQQGLAQKCWLHEMVLVRPVLETCVRLLFAVRVRDGWARYERYWAQQDKDWALAAKEHFPGRPSWDAWLADAEATLAAFPVEPMNYKMNTAMRAIIDAERAAMLAGGEGGAAPDEDADVVHLILFKLAHAVTHGSPEYLVDNFDAHDKGLEFKTGSGMLFSQSAYLMTRAVYFLRGWPNREADATAFVKRTKRPERPKGE